MIYLFLIVILLIFLYENFSSIYKKRYRRNISLVNEETVFKLKLKTKTTSFPLKFSSNRLWHFLMLTQLTRLYSRYIYIYIKSKINMGVCQIWTNTVPTYYFIRWGENPYINQRGVAGLVGISINSRSKRVSLVKREASTILSVLNKSLLCFLF